MRANKDGRIPVVALRWVAGRWLRFDINRFTGREVNAREVSLLPLSVEHVGVAGLGGRLMPITAKHHLPICGSNPVDIVCSRRPPLSVVILGTTVNIVKRLAVIQGQLVILRDRQILHVAPGGTQIKALIQTAIRTHHDVIGITRVKHDSVHIAMLIGMRHGREGFAPVL